MSKAGGVSPAFYRWHLALLAPVLFTSHAAFSQSAPQSTPQANAEPEVIHVELQIGDGSRTAYHIGEIVPVKLIFTSTAHTKHWISWEHCGAEETYPVRVPPHVLTGWGAQESAALLGGGWACTSHGFGGEVDLSAQPYVDFLTLNHRYRLDTPGTYPLTWSGIAIGQSGTSNTANLTLLPRDPVWEAKELARADALLDGPDGPNSHRYDGCSLLRYLGTPEAALDMARRYGGSQGVCGNGFKIPLVNATNRAAVLHILEHKFLSPDFYSCRSPGFLETMALISVYRTHPEWYRAVTEAQRPAAQARPPVASAVEEAELRYTRQVAVMLPHHYCTY
ncbi:MAG: hypothetical protein WCA13_18055 [Terriglobales bacterium]